MAEVICPSCRATNGDGDALCSICGHLLADAAPAADPPQPAVQAVAATERCPACGADVPDPANRVCVECLAELPRLAAAAPGLPTRREAAAVLRLVFPGRPVDVPKGSILLGRDPELSPVAPLFAASDNISRRHASVGVEPDGTAWVRDESSTNGTFVNDRRVAADQRTPLADGDRLRLASDVVAEVELGGGVR